MGVHRLATANNLDQRIGEPEPGAQHWAADLVGLAAAAQPNTEHPSGWALLQDVDPDEAIAQVLVVIAQDLRGIGCGERTHLPRGRPVQRIRDPAEVGKVGRHLQTMVPADEAVFALFVMTAALYHVDSIVQLTIVGIY